MARLVEIVTGFGAMVDVPQLLEQISDDARDLLTAVGAGVAIRDGDRLTIAAASEAHRHLVGRSFPIAGSAVGVLVESGRRSMAAQGGGFVTLAEDLFHGQPMRLFVALTRADGASAGALYVARQEPLSSDEFEALELLAAHAGAALHTAEVFAKAKELEEAKDLFLAMASHELRTPLTVLRGFAETLINHWDALEDVGKREIVATMLARTSAMTALVEQLLLGSRAGIGVEVTNRPFDLAAAVRVAASAVAGSSDEHPLLVAADGVIMARGDEATVDAILGQLVENAMKYSPEGGPVEIAVRRDGEEAVLSVADAGVGIAEEDLGRVFDRFVRSTPQDRAGVPGVGGVGLGLWIVKRYVQAQRGRVVALRRPGGGTVIEVRLPAG
ncbi:MAG: two-component system, NtrC family, sensor histidine kinase KinB [Actinomycetota bacterium]|jgi:signal transduction histidine kinase|nr:two-component system, NtrC family, sensor histidine kinase KinB [Actinomycetota bacterium]